MHLGKRTLLPTLLLLCAGSLAQADSTLYSNLGAGSGYTSSSYWDLRGPNATYGEASQGFQFVASGSGNVTSVEVALQHVQGDANLTLELFTDSGSNTLGSVKETLSSSVPDSAGLVTFNATSSVALTAGQKYWLVGVPAGNTSDDWFENNAGIETLNYYDSATFGTGYRTIDSSGAFQINGTAAVPELSSVLGFGAFAVLGGIGMVRMRRKTAEANA